MFLKYVSQALFLSYHTFKTQQNNVLLIYSQLTVNCKHLKLDSKI